MYLLEVIFLMCKSTQLMSDKWFTAIIVLRWQSYLISLNHRIVARELGLFSSMMIHLKPDFLDW